jgi:hypothetical protein
MWRAHNLFKPVVYHYLKQMTLQLSHRISDTPCVHSTHTVAVCGRNWTRFSSGHSLQQVRADSRARLPGLLHQRNTQHLLYNNIKNLSFTCSGTRAPHSGSTKCQFYNQLPTTSYYLLGPAVRSSSAVAVCYVQRYSLCCIYIESALCSWLVRQTDCIGLNTAQNGNLKGFSFLQSKRLVNQCILATEASRNALLFLNIRCSDAGPITELSL